jgi:hypothetical protein
MYVCNRVSQCFIEGLETFLETSAKYRKPENKSDVHYICCPCVDCCNEKRLEIQRRFVSTCLLEALLVDIRVGQSTVNIRRLCLRTLMWEVMMM